MRDIFSYAYGQAAQDTKTDLAPAVIKQLAILNQSQDHWHPPCHTTSTKRSLAAMADVAALNEQLAMQTAQAVINQHFFITLGGDHSAGIGSWSGAINASSQPIGLLWIDAHLDSHTPESSETKNIHGMPLATLLGKGESRLTRIAKTPLKPAHVCVLGARSYEAPESALLMRLGVRVITTKEYHTRGAQACQDEILSLIGANGRPFGVSFDVDGLDPTIAPGVGTPAPDGLLLKDVSSLFDRLPRSQWLGLDICEYNPTRDINQRTLTTIEQLLAHVPGA